MTTLPEAISRLHDTAVLWAAGDRPGADVVLAACDALVAGVDGPSLAALAGISLRAADRELPDTLAAALAELGLPYHPPGSVESEVVALKLLASRALAGHLAPRELARWTNRTCGHDRVPLALAEPLAALDDEYELREHGAAGRDGTAPPVLAELDALVLTAARHIMDAPALTPGQGSVNKTAPAPGRWSR